MSNLGFSGATVTITGSTAIKRGKNDLEKQADYCRQFPTVFPKIYGSGADWYSMEKLYEVTDFRQIFPRAMANVMGGLWSHERTQSPEWRFELEVWATDYPWISDPLIFQFCYGTKIQSCVHIHGDLTLANLMERAHGGPVWIDPLVTGNGDKIPSFIEVDLAKLWQSALGWEGLLAAGAALPLPWLERQVSRIAEARGVSMEHVMFWSMVHLARILPYAKDQKVLDWAEQHSRRLSSEFSV